MKVQIDTVGKTVKLIDNININELVKALKVMLGDGYKDYSIEATGIIYTYTPWYQYYPTQPWVWPGNTITYGKGNEDYMTTVSTYNIDIQSSQ